MNLDNSVIGIVVDDDGRGGQQFTRIVTYDARWGLEDWIGFPWNVVNARMAARNDAYERERRARMFAYERERRARMFAYVWDDEGEY